MWTMETTEGFTQTELDMINRVAERAFAAGDDELEVYSINDAITQCWHEGISEAHLESKVWSRLGL